MTQAEYEGIRSFLKIYGQFTYIEILDKDWAERNPEEKQPDNFLIRDATKDAAN